MFLRTLITTLILLAPASLFAQDELNDGAELKVQRVSQHELKGTVNGQKVTVRLMGLNCNTKKSSNAVKKIIGGKNVILRSDKSFLPIVKDQHDRYVAYVETVQGEDLGHALVKSGACTVAGWKISHPKQQLYASTK